MARGETKFGQGGRGGTVQDNRLRVTVNCVQNGQCLDQTFFIADRTYEVLAVYEIHAVAGDHASPVNLQVTKDTGTNAPGAGTDLLANNANAGFDMKGTANTLQTGALVAATTSKRLLAGNRLSLDFAGTVQNLAGVTVTVVLKPA
jgi:hypothetical protein